MVADRVARVRSFNRFYTNVIGVLGDGLLRTPFSLTEARVIFELAQRDATEVVDLRRTLDIDAAYLTRLIDRFEANGLVTRERSPADGRRRVLRLTHAGRDAFELLDRRAVEETEALLAQLTEDDQRRLVGAMTTIEELLGPSPGPPSVALRRPAPEDLEWVVRRHGALYAEEFGWDERFEALVAGIVAGFAEHHDPERERGWIAEVGGERGGCVFCMRKSKRVARLRLLLVEPRARGIGIGSRLVDECLSFAQRAGYAQVTLWTNDVLVDARRIYERAGFELVDEERHRSFGPELIGQSWRLALRPPKPRGRA